MSADPKYRKQTNGERTFADFIPYSSHVSPNTLVTRDGDFIRMWKIDGISFETADPDEMLLRKEQLNTLLRSISSDRVAVWSHNLRRKTSDRLKATFENSFCRDFNDKYYDSFTGYRMMANELYLTVIYRPNPSRISSFLQKSSRRSHSQIMADQRKSIKKLDDVAFQIESSLSRYGIEELATYSDANGNIFSHALTFLHYLLTGEWHKVRVPVSPLNEYLGTAWLFVGAETIEIRTPTKTRFAQCVDFKDYNAHTEPGILNGLMYGDYEYIITQSFSFMTKSQGKEFLERQRAVLKNTEDGSSTQIEQITSAIDQLIQGEFSMGEYHFSLMIFGDSIDDVRRNTTSAMTVLQETGFLAALVGTATDAAFYAQLPANWSFRPRIAGLTSKNFAGLSPFHNFTAGKRDGNPWGQAVTLFKTPSGQPLYFNYHYARGDEDSFDKKLLGNTRIIGPSGAGKTALMNTLTVQSQKFMLYKESQWEQKFAVPFTNIFFDFDEGAMLCIKAMGGKYLSIKNGVQTGFQPLQMESSPKNILFIEDLIRGLVSGENKPVTTADEQRISHAVRTVMKMPKQYRRLSTVLQNITEGTDKEDRENSIAKRLSRWCYDDGRGKQGPLAWVLDCPTDVIDFTTHSNYGFDGTDFLDNAEVRTPISKYLLYRMKTVIDGRRFIYNMDECWKWIDDEAFADFAGKEQVTIRKKNGLGVFATQMPKSILKSKIAAALIEQVATEIYLPNPKADYKDYVEGFKCTLAEYDIIRTLGEDSRMFLVKQGNKSMIGRLDLSGNFDDELAILSGSTDNNAIAREIWAEIGDDDPDQWIPMFHERRKVRSASSKITVGR
jgi:type IV secretion/conjugal transfer VirB4 family ATPase